MAGINKDGELCPVAHEVGVAGVVLDDAAAEHDHARAGRAHRQVVDPPDVLHDVQHELGSFVRVEIHHISEGAVRESGAEHGTAIVNKSSKSKVRPLGNK